MIYRVKRKRTKSTKIIFAVIIRIVIVALFTACAVTVFWFYKSIKKAKWDGKNNLNLVIESEDIYLLSLHPQDELVYIIRLPPNLWLPSARGYGDYQLRNIYHLGELEEVGGGKLLMYSLQNFFKVSFDGYCTGLGENNFKNGKINKIFFSSLKRKTDCSLSAWEMLSFFWINRKLGISQNHYLDLGESDLLKKEKMADSTSVFKLEEMLIDDFSQKYFTDTKIIEEGLRLAVVNGTEKPGLAKHTAGMLKNIGFEIIDSGNTENKMKTTKVFYGKEAIKESYSLQKIIEVFELEKANKKEKINGDIEIVIGQDFLKKYF